MADMLETDPAVNYAVMFGAHGIHHAITLQRSCSRGIMHGCIPTPVNVNLLSLHRLIFIINLLYTQLLLLTNTRAWCCKINFHVFSSAVRQSARKIVSLNFLTYVGIE